MKLPYSSPCKVREKKSEQLFQMCWTNVEVASPATGRF